MNWDKIKQVGLLGVVALLLVMIGLGAFDRWQNGKELARLRNEAAAKDQTIEVQKGLYTKLTLESDNLNKLLNTKDEQIQSLVTQVKKDKEQLLAANQLVVTWKKAYEALFDANQTHEDPPTPGGPGRDKVSFVKDWGAIVVSGYTYTNPPEAFLSVKQGRPWKITVAISQDANRQWHTYATSSDDNLNVDIALTAVNPYILEPKWYERLSLSAMVAGGSGTTGFGLLAGIGATFRIDKFNVGPAGFVTVGSNITGYVGAVFEWRPFER